MHLHAGCAHFMSRLRLLTAARHVPGGGVQCLARRSPREADQRAQAYASFRTSAPALTKPLATSTTIAALAPIDHGPDTVSVWPLAASAFCTASAMRPSTDRSPGCMVCGNGDAGKLRVDQRGASIA